MTLGKASAKTIATSNAQIIDWSLCLKLASNKKEVAEEILAYVIEHLPADLKEIEDNYAEKNFKEMLKCVHKLHGGLCYSGLP